MGQIQPWDHFEVNRTTWKMYNKLLVWYASFCVPAWSANGKEAEKTVNVIHNGSKTILCLMDSFQSYSHQNDTFGF